MKEISVTLGRYGVALQGPEEAMEYLSRRWSKYVECGAEAPETTISLHYANDLLRHEHTTGWRTEQKGEQKRVTYYREGIPCFALSCLQDRKNIQVHFVERQYHNMTIGIQYAIMLGLSSVCVGLHGVTVICGDKVVILSASSGTGKTTLSKLLRRYNQTATVNGDFALLSVDEMGRVIFEPTPLCGSSGVCHNYRLPVDRIVFLEQATENRWQSLTARQALMKMLSNVFIPEWDPELKADICRSVGRIVGGIPMNAYGFRPEIEAAEVFESFLNR